MKMEKRYVSIWFRNLVTDYLTRRNPVLGAVPFAVALPQHGRLVITSLNQLAINHGVVRGMVVADARALVPGLEIIDDDAELPGKLLNRLGDWYIRFSPLVAIDPPEGLMIDATGCTHLWGGEQQYLTEIATRMKKFGYSVGVGMSSTIGVAWATARFEPRCAIVNKGEEAEVLRQMPAAALRIDIQIIHRLEKLGLLQINSFIDVKRSALRRRFGDEILVRLDQALGHKTEIIHPLHPVLPFEERLPCLDPIVSAEGISIALEKMLKSLCKSLRTEEKGLRKAHLKCFRVDGKLEMLTIGTHRPSCNPAHLFKLFETGICTIEPDLGIELFILEAHQVEGLVMKQEQLWLTRGGLDDIAFSELIDRLSLRLGASNLHRYIPAEHYWPERSFCRAENFHESPAGQWIVDRPRPFEVLRTPAPIEVMAPIPDYPPMLFRYKGTLHKIEKADGPERIEQEWWIEEGQHRDYYYVEDEGGGRYWIYRSGHYDDSQNCQWYLHGFFC